jgi:competence protein ComEA
MVDFALVRIHFEPEEYIEYSDETSTNNQFAGGSMKATLKKKIIIALLISLAVIFAGACGAMAMDKVNINTAPVEKLMQLDRVGAKYAKRIVAYRETVGPFKKPEDIMKVKGIGQKTWEVNKDRIVI